MKRLIASLPMLMTAAPALAHVDPGAHGAVAGGFVHPMLGADHLMAMVAVGLLAVTMAGRAVATLPLAFIGGMAGGFALALAGAVPPGVEPVVLASVMVIGGLVALTARLPLGAVAVLVTTFGAFHGLAHGSELGEAGTLPFAAGMLAGTASLHAGGLVLGLMLRQQASGAALRLVGGLTALGGAVLALA